MLSIKGNEILSVIYAKFRSDWIEQFPGHNENDVERHFLYSIHHSLIGYNMPIELASEIEKIR